MGVSTQAMRVRIKRGSLEHRRDNRGRLLVQVANDEAQPGGDAGATLRERVARLEERLANADALRARVEGELAEVKAERDRLLALVERLAAERRPEHRPWPGLKAWWRRVWEGEGS
jgi:chromosome segregation ATPase